MNCRPGDLALVVRGCSGPCAPNIGKAVRCIALEDPQHPTHPGHYVPNPIFWGRIWRVDRGLIWETRGGPPSTSPHIPDACLWPIRPDEVGADEIVERINERITVLL